MAFAPFFWDMRARMSFTRASTDRAESQNMAPLGTVGSEQLKWNIGSAQTATKKGNESPIFQ
jgi:hypothetical protein